MIIFDCTLRRMNESRSIESPLVQAPNSPQIEIWQSAMNTGDRLSPTLYCQSFLGSSGFSGLGLGQLSQGEQTFYSRFPAHQIMKGCWCLGARRADFTKQSTCRED